MNKNSIMSEQDIENVFDAYIKRIIKRSAAREVKRQVKIAEMERALIGADIAVEVNFDVDDENIDKILSILKETDRNVIILNICEEIPLVDVAQILDINYQTARIKKMRALIKLKKWGERDGLCKI